MMTRSACSWLERQVRMPRHSASQRSAEAPRGKGQITRPQISVLLRLICRDPSHLWLGFIFPPRGWDKRANRL